MIKPSKPIKNSKAYSPGISPEKDAWFTAFYIENHLDPITHPDHAAPPAQVRFMVYLDEDERYYPCSNRMFETIMRRDNSRFLQKKYQEVLQRVMALIADQIEDHTENQFLESLIKIKYEHETRDQIMIPSRLEKRLIRIFLDRTQIEDPYMYKKALRNYRADSVLKTKTLQKALNHIDPSALKDSPISLAAIRGFTDQIVIQRLFSLSVENTLWETDVAAKYQLKDYHKIFKKNLTGNGVKPLIDFLGLNDASEGDSRRKRILWLANEAGEVMMDFAIMKYLTKLGHKVIIAFKDGPLFTKVDYYDAQGDETLARELEGSLCIEDENLTKNELVRTLKSNYSILVISDGTRENLNLLLASTTFARMFKEVDGIISRGHDQKR
ncbi:MAG: ARMT1-like domain-containing protein, partial [Planctomycetota bacterium]